MTYTQVAGANVFATISKGSKMIVCDFGSNAIKDCEELTVGQIRNFISQTNTAFFKVDEATS